MPPLLRFLSVVRFGLLASIMVAGMLYWLPGYCAHVVEGSDLTEVEWLAWPEWCKAGFLGSEWSNSSQFKGRMDSALVEQVRKNYYETYGISGPHHLCLAMVYLNRARALVSGGQFSPRYNAIKGAINELGYCYARTPKNAGGFSLLAGYRGTAFFLDGQREAAMKAWKEGLDLQPDRKESYLAMAQAFFSEKRYQEALDILLKYDGAKAEEAADGEYFLGYAYYQLGHREDALRHLDRAVELGYPYTGLRDKVRNLAK